MTAAPTVSVVMPAYNAAGWIGEALESALTQSYPVLEVLVVDDGSTDDTLRVAAGFGAKVRPLREPHRGVPRRNLGIAAARGDLIAFLDADDLWVSSKLEKQVDALAAGSKEWVISDSRWLDSLTGAVLSPKGARVREGDILEALLLGNFIVASTVLVSRTALNAVGNFEEDDELIPGEDWDLWMRLAARYSVACVYEPLTVLRLHGASLMRSRKLDRSIRSQENVIVRAVERESTRLAKHKRQALSNLYHSTAVRLFREERLSESRPYFWRSWVQTPWRVETAAYLGATVLGARGAGAVAGIRRRLLGGR